MPPRRRRCPLASPAPSAPPPTPPPSLTECNRSPRPIPCPGPCHPGRVVGGRRGRAGRAPPLGQGLQRGDLSRRPCGPVGDLSRRPRGPVGERGAGSVSSMRGPEGCATSTGNMPAALSESSVAPESAPDQDHEKIESLLIRVECRFRVGAGAGRRLSSAAACQRVRSEHTGDAEDRRRRAPDLPDLACSWRRRGQAGLPETACRRRSLCRAGP